jgi:ribosomal-protein-serine acetyltransferase
MSPPPFLAPLEHTADDLTLRVYRPGDGAALQLAVESSYEHLRPWMLWVKGEQSLEESEATCRRLAGNYLAGTNFMLGIWRGDELLGGTGFHLSWGGIESGNAETGMWIAADHAGRGLGTRVLAIMLEWGFTMWPWQRIVWQCDTRNIPSARVAEKNGLAREGTFRSDSIDVDGRRRDTYLYAMLRAEWEERRAQVGVSSAPSQTQARLRHL